MHTTDSISFTVKFYSHYDVQVTCTKMSIENVCYISKINDNNVILDSNITWSIQSTGYYILSLYPKQLPVYFRGSMYISLIQCISDYSYCLFCDVCVFNYNS